MRSSSPFRWLSVCSWPPLQIEWHNSLKFLQAFGVSPLESSRRQSAMIDAPNLSMNRSTTSCQQSMELTYSLGTTVGLVQTNYWGTFSHIPHRHWLKKTTENRMT
ncbi:hypothetical protein LIER_00590 [Lithospermum erythrorhizon]|uniref:Uncharacterized protein n=1 Tax=Lithospermum erythrorhizon TaxID=34254 RepID=A0AAV3NJ26_LITER